MSYTVLIVEQDDQVRCVTRRTLVNAGFRVLEAPDAPAALAILRRVVQHIDLVLIGAVGSSPRPARRTAPQR